MSIDRRVSGGPPLVELELQAAVPALFSFGSSAWRFYFAAGSPFASICLQLAVLFSLLVQTLLRVSGSLADDV